MILLSLAISTSLIGTLQNAVCAEITKSFHTFGVSFVSARLLTLVLNVLAVYISCQQINILQLSAIGQAAASTIFGPIFLCFWSKMNMPHVNFSGCLVGVFSIMAQGWYLTGNFIYFEF